jgi:hypothetical protein
MLVDARGQYAGSWFSSRIESEQPHLTKAIAVATRAAGALQSQGYFGPLGIDAMIYRDEAGIAQVRPLQDINARWTMGRLSLGWTRLLEPGEEGLWWHGTDENKIAANSIGSNCSIISSPAFVNATPCRHQSRILIRRQTSPIESP